MAGRNSTLRGDIIVLTAVFLDAAGNEEDPTDLTLSIYPPGFNPESEGVTTADAWVYGVTLNSPGSGPEVSAETVVRTSEGRYQYSFRVPEDADLGTSFDRWQATLDLEELDETFTFVVVGGGSVGTTYLYENNLVNIKLDSTIASLTGETLGEDNYFYFTTTYNPLYASARQARLEMGPFVSDLPDDTINLALFESSLAADINSFQVSSKNPKYMKYAKQRYTLIRAEIMLLRAMTGDPSANKMSKKLGDFYVSRDGNLNAIQNRIDDLEKELKEWRKAVRTGGDIATGASLRPQYAVKGKYAEDAICVGRQWQPTTSICSPNENPAGNYKRPVTSRKCLKTYKNRTHRNLNDVWK